jgi:hypothetical protein
MPVVVVLGERPNFGFPGRESHRYNFHLIRKADFLLSRYVTTPRVSIQQWYLVQFKLKG